MQRRHMFVIGASAAFAILTGALAASWLMPDGSLRNAHWQQPQPVTIDVAALVPNMPKSPPWDNGQLLMQLQERPLFILSRRPLPTLKKTEEKPPEPDIWDQARLLGIFQGHKSGVILMVQGKEQRLMLNQSLGGWTLSAILPRRIELDKAGVKRNLELFRAPVDAGPASSAPAVAWRPAAPAPFAPAPAADMAAPQAANAESKPEPVAVFGGTKTGK